MSASDALPQPMTERALKATYQAGYEEGFTERDHSGDRNPTEAAARWLQGVDGQAVLAILQGGADLVTGGTVEVDVFDKPSGNVRGMVTAFLRIKGRPMRIAHATLLVGETAAVTIDVPSKLALELVVEASALLTYFASTVREHELQG